MPDATAAALPPELPPADLCSRLSQGVEDDEVWWGFTTGPCEEWMFKDLF